MSPSALRIVSFLLISEAIERLLLKLYNNVIGNEFKETLDELETDTGKEIAFDVMESYTEFLKPNEKFKHSQRRGDCR